MKVDILLATYNGEAFLREQIESLLAQTHQDIHLIIRDDGSTDETRGIITSYAGQYPEKIEIILDNENLGPQQNFAKLMHFSKSEYIMFCDQDDVWKKDKVEKTLSCLKQDRSIPQLVHTDLCVVDRNLNVLAPSFWEYVKLNPNKNTLNRLVVQNVVTGCTILMNRPLLELAKNMPKEAVMHDWWIALVAAAFGKIAFLNEATLYYRQHGKNQVGANRYSLLSLMKKGVERLRSRKKFGIQHKQVEAFYTQFKDRLNPDQKEMLESYLSLPFCGYFTGRCRIIRSGFFRSGILRNVGLLLISNQP